MKALLFMLFTFLSLVLGILMYPTVVDGLTLPQIYFSAFVFLTPWYVILRLFMSRQTKGCLYLWLVALYSGNLYWLVAAVHEFGGLPLFVSLAVVVLVNLILAGFLYAAWMSAWRMSRIWWMYMLSWPVLLSTMDWLRTLGPFSGFPWVIPAYALEPALAFFQWIDVTGVFGLNLIVYLVNALFGEIIIAWIQNYRMRAGVLGLGLILIGAVSLTGSMYRSSRGESYLSKASGITVGLVQGNISQDQKWEASRLRKNLDVHLDLTLESKRLGAELVMWPESSYPYTVLSGQEGTLPGLDLGRLGVPVLLGSVLEANHSSDIYWNAALLLNSQGVIQSSYAKRKLVPFGEYVPLKDYLFFARRLTQAVADFTPGLVHDPMPFQGRKLGLLICYEDIFPEASRQTVLRGADLLVNITNDAWYGHSSALYQHRVFSQFRALENRRSLVRATNTGLTSHIHPSGRVLFELSPLKAAFANVTVVMGNQTTPYTLYGDWIIAMGLGLIAGSLFFQWIIQRRLPENAG